MIQAFKKMLYCIYLILFVANNLDSMTLRVSQDRILKIGTSNNAYDTVNKSLDNDPTCKFFNSMSNLQNSHKQVYLITINC